MRTFTCQCGSRIFFENRSCTNCGARLGFFPSSLELVALGPSNEVGAFQGPGGAVGHECELFGQLCNWLVEDGAARCRACRLNVVELDTAETNRVGSNAAEPTASNAAGARPAADDEHGRQVMEASKRRLLFTLFELGLDVPSRHEDADGLAFALTRTDPDDPDTPAMTGHADGLITINLAEASPLERESTRLSLGENYRTVLGHFRHESGHFFWDRLVRDGGRLDEFRALFGDERNDYEEALRKHYEAPRPFDASLHVSPYATMHPWEDFAETWAHYLHLFDTWETAQSFGLAPRSTSQPHDFHSRLSDWSELMLALNALNRSMGQPDAYPFAIGPAVADKLAFVEDLIRRAPGASERRSADPALEPSSARAGA